MMLQVHQECRRGLTFRNRQSDQGTITKSLRITISNQCRQFASPILANFSRARARVDVIGEKSLRIALRAECHGKRKEPPSLELLLRDVSC